MKFKEVQIKKLKSGVIPGTETEAVLHDVEVFLEDQKMICGNRSLEKRVICCRQCY